MIFDRKIRYNSFFNELIIHSFIFIFISLNLFSSSYIINFTLLTAVVIFLSKGTTMNWYYPLMIFLWGIYSDLITGYPIGYSSTLFLLFLMLNQLSNFFGIFFLDTIRFITLLISLLFLTIFEHLFLYFKFSTNIFTAFDILEFVFVLIFYFPINYFIKNNLKLYASKE